MRWAKFVLILIAVAVFSGCALSARPVKAKDVLDPSFGYIFGRFSLTQNSADMGIAINIAGDPEDPRVRFDNYNFYLYFISHNVYAVAVKPGKYYIKEIIYLYPYGRIGKVAQFQSKSVFLNRSFEVQTNTLFYIGDFVGSVNWDYNYTYTLSIQSITDHFYTSWDTLIEDNPGFENMNTNSIFNL